MKPLPLAGLTERLVHVKPVGGVQTQKHHIKGLRMHDGTRVEIIKQNESDGILIA